MCPTKISSKIPAKKSFFGIIFGLFSGTFRDAIIIISIFGMHTCFGEFGFLVVGHLVSSLVSDATMPDNHATDVLLLTSRTLLHLPGQPRRK